MLVNRIPKLLYQYKQDRRSQGRPTKKMEQF